MNAPKLARVTLLGVLSVTLGACGILKKKQPEPSPSTTVAPAATAPTVVNPLPTPTAVTEVTVADEAVPAPEDFEDEAFEKVTDKTYKAQVELLKKEIEAP